MRCAVYARYSTDHQKDSSIEDQVSVCNSSLQRMGIEATEIITYEDRAASGASMHLRPGIKKLMRDAADRRFDLVIAESMSRYSRDQEDIAYIFKRLTFNEVQMSTTTRYQVSEMDIGFEGTISAQYLKDCAAQVRRGMRGNAERGKNQGGLSYGYNIVREFDAHGEPIRGELEINEDEAAIVRRIYEEYTSGLSPRAIVRKLNDEGIPAPRAKAWRMSTINGDAKRMNGILHNQKYIGYLIWNRTHAVRNPDSGKRLLRMNPKEQWVIVEKPELRLISDDLWNLAQSRKKIYGLSGANAVKARRPTRLLSGLLRCGCCGGSMSVRGGGKNGRGYRSAIRYGCTNYTDTTRCESAPTIKQVDLEKRVLETLKQRLLSPEAWNAFLRGYRKRQVETERQKSQLAESSDRELAEIRRKIENITNAVENGLFQEAMIERMKELASREKELQKITQRPANSYEPATKLPANLPTLFKNRVLELETHLATGPELLQTRARERIRELISKIELRPIAAGENWEITIHGLLAVILAFSQNSGSSDKVAPTMVAEDRTGLERDPEILTITVRLYPIDG